MEHRAFGTLEIKAVDEDKRIIEGIASTPTTDRVGDIVEPLGVQYQLPVPLKWQHGKDAFVGDTPIGNIREIKPTKDGIWVRAQIERDDVPGRLKDILDFVWRVLRKKLVRKFSIGFNPLESEPIKGTYGERFTLWELLELSPVTIAANNDSDILVARAFDAEQQAAHGQKLNGGARRITPPGASGSIRTPPRARGGPVFDIAAKIKDLEATRQAKNARMVSIQETAGNDGRTKDAGEKEEFDTLKDDIKGIDGELKDLSDMQAMMKVAKAVDPAPNGEAGSGSRSTVVRVQSRVDKGIGMARLVKVNYMARKQNRDVSLIARELYPDDHMLQKAVVAGASTTGNTWGHQLVGDETNVFADFVSFLRPMTIVGKFGTNGIPALRTVPFDTPLITQTNGGQGYWVGEGQAKPLTALGFDRTTLVRKKCATIAVASKEVLRSSSPSVDPIIRDSLVEALRQLIDETFVDIQQAGSATVPASITNGANTIASSGTDGDAARLDVRSVFQGFIDADNPPTTGVWIMSSSNALALSLLVNALGQREFPGINLNGGEFQGLPVITSEYVGDLVILVNASDIYVGDEGGFEVDMSTEASLEMKDQSSGGAGAVSNNIITPTAAALVSLWQTNSVGFLAEREINWALRRSSSVQVLTGVVWGGPVSTS